MTDTYRALCAELTEELHEHTSLYEGHESELIARARALLAQPEPARQPTFAELLMPPPRSASARPEPVAPTDEELVKQYDRAVTAAIAIRVAVRALTNEDRDAATVAGLRAVLARWGTPANNTGGTH
jgi:hypothetical protein